MAERRKLDGDREARVDLQKAARKLRDQIGDEETQEILRDLIDDIPF